MLIITAITIIIMAKMTIVMMIMVVDSDREGKSSGECFRADLSDDGGTITALQAETA